MGALQKLQNSIQSFVIFWPVDTIHTNSLFEVIFEDLPFCHFPSLNTSILLLSTLADLSFQYLTGSFSNKQKAIKHCVVPENIHTHPRRFIENPEGGGINFESQNH